MGVLKELREAANNGYEELQAKCHEMESRIAGEYPSLPFMDETQLLDLPKDRYSKTLISSDVRDMLPLACNGDGNCLYR